jgi:BirA family biotin operon repressor/biotin-[acetyl-CoA-carboxylase] ligase
VKAGPARVLDELRRAGGRTLSGQGLSSTLGVSRAQVWKHVESLRSSGYDIEADAGEGYRLVASPDRLYAEEVLPQLDTKWLAREIHWLDETDSTNRVALELALAGAPHGTAVIAEGQTAGRGRLGRSFHSPPYCNLYTSVVLRPDMTTDAAPAFILAAAAAVADTVADTLGSSDAVEIKWPNDVLLDGRKTCGILVELGAEASRVSHLVIGIGVNLNVDPAEFPEEFRAMATSLAGHTGRHIERAEFTRSLYANLERYCDACAAGGFDAVRPAFERHFRMTGRRVRVREFDGKEIEGTVDGIDAVGALLLTTDDARTTRLLAGDVTICKEPS